MTSEESKREEFDEVAFVRLLAACERRVFGVQHHDEVTLSTKRPVMKQFDASYMPSLSEVRSFVLDLAMESQAVRSFEHPLVFHTRF